MALGTISERFAKMNDEIDYKRSEFEAAIEGLYGLRFVATFRDEDEYKNSDINAVWQLWQIAIEAALEK